MCTYNLNDNLPSELTVLPSKALDNLTEIPTPDMRNPGLFKTS